MKRNFFCLVSSFILALFLVACNEKPEEEVVSAPVNTDFHYEGRSLKSGDMVRFVEHEGIKFPHRSSDTVDLRWVTDSIGWEVSTKGRKEGGEYIKVVVTRGASDNPGAAEAAAHEPGFKDFKEGFEERVEELKQEDSVKSYHTTDIEHVGKKKQ